MQPVRQQQQKRRRASTTSSTASGVSAGTVAARAQRKTSGIFRRVRQDSEGKIVECSSDPAMGDAPTTALMPVSASTPGFASAAAVRAVTKTGSSACPELLQTFDIKGSSAVMVSASRDFRRFATIDDAGIPYVLEEIALPDSPKFVFD